ncbi:lipocalin family protein [Flavobacterium sp. MC2016-06]|jgi:hypothetical protein|uniref:lipocalin family protein n=1 Tax=Flavobacterium sp. MC2016-06 TaxID=2676308 RepID=UPI0012BAC872|nr:lipocalin family protein [Flavobacterium sp. MC2016-06]MBU3860794.1 hypothetical protein [Flavobacterium sp. MC2016-06]
MKKLLLLLVFIIGFSGYTQTSKELLGKWQLVKWTKNGKDKDIKSYFKTDQVYQVFLDGGEFQSINGEQIHKGKWKLSKDNASLTITSTLMPVKFQIDTFTAQKRIMTYASLGTFEYKKVDN